jgi:hypothetical protein
MNNEQMNKRMNEQRTNEPASIIVRHLSIVHTSSQAQQIWYKHRPRQYKKHLPNNWLFDAVHNARCI